MNVEERILAAVSLEPVDRHPVFPILVTAAPRLRGITQGEAWRDHEKAREALLWCWREFGYDVISKPNYYYPMIPGRFCGAPVRNLIPGRQLPEDALYQIDERVLFPREDYDRIAALPTALRGRLHRRGHTALAAFRHRLGHRPAPSPQAPPWEVRVRP